MWLASESTSSNYLNVVNRSLVDNSFFLTFKSNPNYTNIVGMSGKEQGRVWYENIKNNYKNIFDILDIFKGNDKIGNINVYEDESGISPNTLRYINTLVEIITYFNLDRNSSLVISELGIGYGGLCFILSKYFNQIEKYILIDLPEVQEFSKKYLTHLNINNTTFEFQNSDLFISEFCLSEFDDDDMYNFYDLYIVNSKCIYLHMNLHDELRKEKFLSRLSIDFDYSISDEFPKTEWPNYVIRGTKKIK